MAYIIGLVSKKEAQTLELRGWKFEAPPKELVDAIAETNDTKLVMVFVNSDLFTIMNGPDWEAGSRKYVDDWYCHSCNDGPFGDETNYCRKCGTKHS